MYKLLEKNLFFEVAYVLFHFHGCNIAPGQKDFNINKGPLTVKELGHLQAREKGNHKAMAA